MKPKNRIYCSECGKKKLLFETEKKAVNFIKFNAEDILEETGFAPTRAYYCECCGGWHVTHKVLKPNRMSRSEKVIESYNKWKEKRHGTLLQDRG